MSLLDPIVFYKVQPFKIELLSLWAQQLNMPLFKKEDLSLLVLL
jgi:hypothetical protein